MLIRYSDGHLERGTLLEASTGTMRVALSLERASVTFTRFGGQWSSDADGPVQVDFTAGSTQRDWHLFCDRLIGLDEHKPWDAESLIAEFLPPRRVNGRGRTVRACTRPLALQLYDRWAAGETVEQLAESLDIPTSRVAARIRAARSFLRQAGRAGENKRA